MTEVTRGVCWHQNFVPWGCLPLTCWYIHLLNHEKMCIKSEVEEILFKRAAMRPSCVHKSFDPNVLSAPTLGLCLNFFSSITADFNILSALRWAIQDQWSSGFTYENQNFYFHSRLPPLMKISLRLPPLVKILHLVFIRWNKIRSYTK